MQSDYCRAVNRETDGAGLIVGVACKKMADRTVVAAAAAVPTVYN